MAAIGSATTGTVTATNAIAISGTWAEVTAALITTESKVNIASPTTVDISDSITVSNASSIAQTNNITAIFSGGVLDTIANLTNSGSITDDLAAITNDDTDVNITVTDDANTSVKATELSSIGDATTGKVTVSNAIDINGTSAELIAALVTDSTKVIASIANLTISDTPTSAQLSELDAVTTGIIKFPPGDVNKIVIPAASISASILITLDDQYEIVDASAVKHITGSTSELKIVYASSEIIGLGNEVVILTDTATSAPDLNLLDSKTSEDINSASVTSISGTVAELNLLYSSEEVSGLGNEDLNISDTTIDANLLIALDQNTSGIIDLSLIHI